jgi:hypothetical protein
MINIVFPAQPGSTKNIDSFWEKDAEAARSAGFGLSLISGTHFAGPVIITGTADRYIYRGWIVKPQAYREMTEATDESFLNSLDDYLWSFEFPRWYDALKTDSPFSLIYEADSIVESGIQHIAKEMSQIAPSHQIQSLILKDYLKSRKHEWFDACFIRDSSDEKEILRIMTNFFNLQGRDFYGGLVFREFLKLKQLGIHPKSRMPLPVEYRTFFFNQKPIFTVPYWDNDVPYQEKNFSPPEKWLEEIGIGSCSG